MFQHSTYTYMYRYIKSLFSREFALKLHQSGTIQLHNTSSSSGIVLEILSKNDATVSVDEIEFTQYYPGRYIEIEKYLNDWQPHHQNWKTICIIMFQSIKTL